MTTKNARKEAERDDARARLLTMLKPGDRVYTVLRHVSASGMSRRISLVVATTDHDGKPAVTSIDWLAARLLSYRQHDRGGLVVGGCGMDMGFHLVYALGSALWPDGTPEPHGRRNGEPDTAGGYALRHEWL
jgi:hypothetical protein